jgi:septal ring factor EnvC (AmiA/AmiB activator)
MKAKLLIIALACCAFGCGKADKEKAERLEKDVERLTTELTEQKAETGEEKKRGDALEKKVSDLKNEKQIMIEDLERISKLQRDIAYERGKAEGSSATREIMRNLNTDYLLDKKEEKETWNGAGLPPGIQKK